MSFGVSIGDVIALGKIVTDISSCLRSCGGSKSEFQELQRELEIFQRILHRLDQLQTAQSSPVLDSVKYAAFGCRQTLKQYLDKINKYERSLGVWSQPSKIRGAKDKLRWGFKERNEVQGLHEYLVRHNGMISTLLVQLGLEEMSNGFSRLHIQGKRIHEITDETKRSVVGIENSIKRQEGFLASLGQLVPNVLYRMVEDMEASLGNIASVLYGVYDSTEKMYKILVEIKSTLPAVDTRWTYFQDPIIVEDPFGVKFPVPSEYDASLLFAIVHHRLHQMGRLNHLENITVEFFYTDNPTRMISDGDRLYPGRCITVAIEFGEMSLLMGYFPKHVEAKCDSRKMGSVEAKLIGENEGRTNIVMIAGVRYCNFRKLEEVTINLPLAAAEYIQTHGMLLDLEEVGCVLHCEGSVPSKKTPRFRASIDV